MIIIYNKLHLLFILFMLKTHILPSILFGSLPLLIKSPSRSINLVISLDNSQSNSFLINIYLLVLKELIFRFCYSFKFLSL